LVNNTKGIMARTFVMGDIHGAYRALRQCLERAAFDYGQDNLIFLGDVADGWPETYACIEELLKIKNLTYIFGNHDFWTLEWMESGVIEDVWFGQGGKATIKSYPYNKIPKAHIDLLNNSLPYLLKDNKLFVHAGIDPHQPLETQGMNIFLWDRNLARTALNLFEKQQQGKLTSYDEVYIGHTPIPFSKPIQACEIWFMDTGAGWSGVLSMMEINTKEVFTSDPVPTLYPGIEGRKRK
jgi:serine/threonine protein phosphatase 1